MRRKNNIITDIYGEAAKQTFLITKRVDNCFRLKDAAEMPLFALFWTGSSLIWTGSSRKQLYLLEVKENKPLYSKAHSSYIVVLN